MYCVAGRLGPSLAAAIAALVLAVPAPAAATDWSAAQTITVVAKEYRFKPKQLIFQRGVAYRLHIDNRGKETHEFHAPEFFQAIEIADPSVLNADKTEIVIPPGDARDLTFVAPQAGRYRLICSDHDWAGMTGKIRVK